MAPRNARRSYNEEDKAKALILLTTNDNNKSKTARELGIPLPTLRTWLREWDKDGQPPVAVTAVLPAVREEFLDKAEKVRGDVLEKIEELIPEATIKNLTPLATTLGILTDKIDKIRGVDVQKHEHVHKHELPSHEEAANFVVGFLQDALEATRKREEIIDAEVVEEQPAGFLPSASATGE